MNRRDLLKQLGAAGLVVATVDVPRFWSLDRTMIEPVYGVSGFSVEFEQLWMETYWQIKREVERHIIFGEPLSPELAKHFPASGGRNQLGGKQ